MTDTDQTPDARRELLVEAGRKLWIDNGPGGVSYGNIARSSGVPKGSMQVYFPTARELTRAVANAVIDAWYEGRAKGGSVLGDVAAEPFLGAQACAVLEATTWLARDDRGATA